LFAISTAAASSQSRSTCQPASRFRALLPDRRSTLPFTINNKQNTQYISQTPRRKIKFDTLPVKEVFGSGVRACGSAEIKLSLDVPPVTPTNMKHCRVLTNSYQLKIRKHSKKLMEQKC
jgi:hypothetical protein